MNNDIKKLLHDMGNDLFIATGNIEAEMLSNKSKYLKKSYERLNNVSMKFRELCESVKNEE